MTVNNLSISLGVKEEVGSSIITREAFLKTALAISTICCWEMDKSDIFDFGFKSKPILLNNSSVSL